MLRVDKLDIEIFLIAVFAFEQKAISQPMTEGFVAVVKIGGGKRGKLADDAVDFTGGDVIGLILAGEVVA